MANVTHTVVKGDTLWALARKYNTTVAKLVELNDIKDPNFIVVGQVLIISGSGATSSSSSTSSKAVIKVFGLQSNTDRTVYATWKWSKSNTENYKIMWYYDTGDGVWFVGNNSTVEDNQCSYTAPTNALRVKFKVKPQSKKKTVNGSETTYWTASWSTEKTYSFSDNPPVIPSAPTVEIKDYTLTAYLDNLDVNGTHIEFQIVKDNQKVFKNGKAKIVTNHASYSCSINAGSEYKVRCRAIRNDIHSDWSDYSGNVGTKPSAPSGITVCRATSKTSVYLEWSAVNTATSYEIQYTTKKEYFDGSDQVTSASGIESTHYEKTGLESGNEYFFRVRATNEKGSSSWSSISSIVIGTDPAAPTTWSSATTVITGEPLTLYWNHNSEDGSSQTYAELELYFNGVYDRTETIQNSTDEEEKDKTSFYTIDTTSFPEGTQIHWRVRTAGVTKVYGDWSVQRTVDIYAPPTLELSMTDVEGNPIETLESFPFYIYGLAGPNTQAPIGYHISVIANEMYEAVDNIGNTVIVNAGAEVYSKHFDITDALLVEFSANNIDLENNIGYTVVCTVSMNSGLTVESSLDFTVAWTDEMYEPNAEIGIDTDTLVAYVRPYCEDIYGTPIEGVTLSVYRREFDGSFVELGTNLDNAKDTFITDPHPALDYARYRIVATTVNTGAVSYYDVPGFPVGEKSVIIQWDEEWTNFDVSSEDTLEQPPWSGSLLKLPYNIDVSDNHSPDVSLVEYIGRKRPVSYYGTQLGESATWKIDIAKDDKETLYALRRLAIWMGDVYVREPSGSGYWANITVSFNQTHCETTIPVTLSLKRVEGGA